MLLGKVNENRMLLIMSFDNLLQGDRHSPTTLDDANSMANRRYY